MAEENSSLHKKVIGRLMRALIYGDHISEAASSSLLPQCEDEKVHKQIEIYLRTPLIRPKPSPRSYHHQACGSISSELASAQQLLSSLKSSYYAVFYISVLARTPYSILCGNIPIK